MLTRTMLSDCISMDRNECELFVCSPSIAEIAFEVRDCNFQAVLSIDSLATEPDAAIDEVLDEEGYKGLIASLGIGISISIPDTLDLSRLRYHTIILAMEGSAEGEALKSRILRFFHLYMRSVLIQGHVFEPRQVPDDQVGFEREVMEPITRSLQLV